MNDRKTMKVDAIRNGTVIDHIPAGRGLRVLEILESEEDQQKDLITIGLNLISGAYGRKDIIKIENRELTVNEVNQIALIAPEATLNIIRDFEVTEKKTVELPEKIEGLMHCPNPNCVTSDETIHTRLLRVSRTPVRLRCAYCERVFNVEEMKLVGISGKYEE
ncbi:MAG: aspartate carbamoyltransferase regulatory subunit [Gemmatimonadetes bacterium]|nr:MAG: aspartate carbamoyltransferase regulatory subunit [Gemmatimonadota bacterium]